MIWEGGSNGYTLWPPRCPPHPSQAALDYAALDLKPFYAGAKVWYQGGFHQVGGEGGAGEANSYPTLANTMSTLL